MSLFSATNGSRQVQQFHCPFFSHLDLKLFEASNWWCTLKICQCLVASSDLSEWLIVRYLIFQLAALEAIEYSGFFHWVVLPRDCSSGLWKIRERRRYSSAVLRKMNLQFLFLRNSDRWAQVPIQKTLCPIPSTRWSRLRWSFEIFFPLEITRPQYFLKWKSTKPSWPVCNQWISMRSLYFSSPLITYVSFVPSFLAIDNQ